MSTDVRDIGVYKEIDIILYLCILYHVIACVLSYLSYRIISYSILLHYLIYISYYIILHYIIYMSSYISLAYRPRFRLTASRAPPPPPPLLAAGPCAAAHGACARPCGSGAPSPRDIYIHVIYILYYVIFILCNIIQYNIFIVVFDIHMI